MTYPKPGLGIPALLLSMVLWPDAFSFKGV